MSREEPYEVVPQLRIYAAGRFLSLAERINYYRFPCPSISRSWWRMRDSRTRLRA